MRNVLPILVAAVAASPAAVAAQAPTAEVEPHVRFFATAGAVAEPSLHGSFGAHVSLAADAPVTHRFSARAEGLVSTTGRAVSILAMGTWSPFRSGVVTLLAGGGTDFDHFRGGVRMVGGEVALGPGAPRLSLRRLFSDQERWLVGIGIEL